MKKMNPADALNLKRQNFSHDTEFSNMVGRFCLKTFKSKSLESSPGDLIARDNRPRLVVTVRRFTPC